MSDCLSHVLPLFLSFDQRAGIVEEAYIHGYFHLSHHAIVHQFSLRNVEGLRPPISVVALEATRKGSLSVGTYSLEGIILEMLNGWNTILDNLWCRIYRTISVCTVNLSTVLFPVGSVKHEDVVSDEPTPVLKGI